MLKRNHSSARDLAHLIRLLTVTTHACLRAPLHYRGLQRLRLRVLSISQSYDQQIELDMDETKELYTYGRLKPTNGMADQSFYQQLNHSKFKCFNFGLWGRGGSCGASQTGGPWSVEEAQTHILFLELRAALNFLLALQTYAPQFINQHILFLIDNCTAIAYLNHTGGTTSKELSNLAVNIWEWCLLRNLTIHVEHIPEKLNNRESCQNLYSSDWKLDTKVSAAIMLKMDPYTCRSI